MVVGIKCVAIRMILFEARLQVIGVSKSVLLLLHLVALLELLELLWILHFEFIADLVKSDDVKRLLSISSRHQNVGEFVLIVKLCPDVVYNCMPAFAVKARLESFDERHHLFSEEAVS